LRHIGIRWFERINLNLKYLLRKVNCHSIKNSERKGLNIPAYSLNISGY